MDRFKGAKLPVLGRDSASQEDNSGQIPIVVDTESPHPDTPFERFTQGEEEQEVDFQGKEQEEFEEDDIDEPIDPRAKFGQQAPKEHVIEEPNPYNTEEDLEGFSNTSPINPHSRRDVVLNFKKHEYELAMNPGDDLSLSPSHPLRAKAFQKLMSGESIPGKVSFTEGSAPIAVSDGGAINQFELNPAAREVFSTKVSDRHLVQEEPADQPKEDNPPRLVDINTRSMLPAEGMLQLGVEDHLRQYNIMMEDTQTIKDDEVGWEKYSKRSKFSESRISPQPLSSTLKFGRGNRDDVSGEDCSPYDMGARGINNQHHEDNLGVLNNSSGGVGSSVAANHTQLLPKGNLTVFEVKRPPKTFTESFKEGGEKTKAGDKIRTSANVTNNYVANYKFDDTENSDANSMTYEQRRRLISNSAHGVGSTGSIPIAFQELAKENARLGKVGRLSDSNRNSGYPKPKNIEIDNEQEFHSNMVGPELQEIGYPSPEFNQSRTKVASKNANSNESPREANLIKFRKPTSQRHKDLEPEVTRQFTFKNQKTNERSSNYDIDTRNKQPVQHERVYNDEYQGSSKDYPHPEDRRDNMIEDRYLNSYGDEPEGQHSEDVAHRTSESEHIPAALKPRPHKYDACVQLRKNKKFIQVKSKVLIRPADSSPSVSQSDLYPSFEIPMVKWSKDNEQTTRPTTLKMKVEDFDSRTNKIRKVVLEECKPSLKEVFVQAHHTQQLDPYQRGLIWQKFIQEERRGQPTQPRR